LPENHQRNFRSAPQQNQRKTPFRDFHLLPSLPNEQTLR